MTRPVLGVELGATTSYIVSSPLNSLATNLALIPSILCQLCAYPQFSYTPNSASRSSSFSLAFVASSISALSTRGSCNSPASSWLSKYSAGSSSSIQDIVTPATIILRTSICEPSPPGCSACGGTSSVAGSAARLAGSTTRTFAPHHFMLLTLGIGLRLSICVRDSHSELAFMMTTRKNCHLNCLICRLSGFRDLVVRLVHVTRVSCVSHDAVRSVPGPRVLLVSRATILYLSVSPVPVFGFSIAPFFVPTMCSEFVSDLLHQILLSHAVFPDDNPRCSGAKILNKMVSASGTVSCM